MRIHDLTVSQGFYPYALEAQADKMTIHEQSGRRAPQRRQHLFVEARPYMCGHMRRNDPATRRFIQYLSMQSSHLIALARDGKTGRILLEPPKEHLWLLRSKAGLGRASKNEWTTQLEIGEKFFAEQDEKRSWRFGHNDYTDIYIWTLEPGVSFPLLYNDVAGVCFFFSSMNYIN